MEAGVCNGTVRTRCRSGGGVCAEADGAFQKCESNPRPAGAELAGTNQFGTGDVERESVFVCGLTTYSVCRPRSPHTTVRTKFIQPVGATCNNGCSHRRFCWIPIARPTHATPSL